MPDGGPLPLAFEGGPMGPSAGPTGATGPAPLHYVVTADGSWAAFTLDGRDFFARCESDNTTGRIVLTEIPDPYVCTLCGLGYQDGPHEHGGRQKPETISTHYAGPAHDFHPRGDFQRTSADHPLAPARNLEESDRICRDEGLPTMSEQAKAARERGNDQLADEIERHMLYLDRRPAAAEHAHVYSVFGRWCYLCGHRRRWWRFWERWTDEEHDEPF